MILYEFLGNMAVLARQRGSGVNFGSISGDFIQEWSPTTMRHGPVPEKYQRVKFIPMNIIKIYIKMHQIDKQLNYPRDPSILESLLKNSSFFSSML